MPARGERKANTEIQYGENSGKSRVKSRKSRPLPLFDLRPLTFNSSTVFGTTEATMLLKTNLLTFGSRCLVSARSEPLRSGFLTANRERVGVCPLYEFLTPFLCLPYWRPPMLGIGCCQDRRYGEIIPLPGFVPWDEVRAMLDLFYVGIVVLFFVGCVAFVRACERL